MTQGSRALDRRGQVGSAAQLTGLRPLPSFSLLRTKQHWPMTYAFKTPTACNKLDPKLDPESCDPTPNAKARLLNPNPMFANLRGGDVKTFKRSDVDNNILPRDAAVKIFASSRKYEKPYNSPTV